MKLFLDRFILNFPRLYIKQFPYAWIALVTLWIWPPNISIIFLVIILVGLLLLRWKSTAWMRAIRNEYAPNGGKFHVDRPPVSVGRAIRNIAILLVVSGMGAFFLKDQLRLNFWQIFLILVGFSLLYRDSVFFGAPVIYIITASGIAVYYAPGHLDYRLFLKFDEINRIERCAFQQDEGWSAFARTLDSNNGLLLIPKNPDGFSKRVKKLFIVPEDIEAFRAQLPYGFA